MASEVERGSPNSRESGSGEPEVSDPDDSLKRRLRHRGEDAIDVAKATFKRYQDNQTGDRAAALTYFAVLSLFPAMLVFVALVGVLGKHPETTDAMLEIVADLGPASAVDTLSEPIEQVTRSSGGAGALLGFGLIGALSAASGYTGAFARASNAIYGTEETRGFLQMRPQQIGITILMLLLLALTAIGLVVSGPVAGAIGETIRVGDTAVTVWNIVKWPVVLMIVASMLAVLYWWAPDIEHVRFRLITVGSSFALLLWIVASAGFGFYVANFGSYDATYGSLGGVIIFLLWIWITQNAILFGAELNAELERRKATHPGIEDQSDIFGDQ